MSRDNSIHFGSLAETNFPATLLQIASHQPAPAVSIVTVRGDIDAANADEFADGVSWHIQRSSRLILDLTGVKFFGTAGFSALQTINAQCVRAGDAHWVLVPGVAVTRVLTICDPGAEYRVADSPQAALIVIGSRPRPLLQLITQPR